MVCDWLEGMDCDWLQEETFLFLNLDQRKPFIFISDSLFFLKFAPRYLASPEALRALVLYLGHFFRIVKRPNWLLKLEKDCDWLSCGKWSFL